MDGIRSFGKLLEQHQKIVLPGIFEYLQMIRLRRRFARIPRSGFFPQRYGATGLRQQPCNRDQEKDITRRLHLRACYVRVREKRQADSGLPPDARNESRLSLTSSRADQ